MLHIIRKSSYILFLSLLLCINLQAQQRFTPELSIGPSAGVTFSKVGFSPTVKENYLLGYTVGAKLRYISEKHLGFMFEPNYSIAGWTENFVDYQPAGNYEYSRSLHYLEFPFMTHMYWGDKQRFFINLGPVARVLVGEKETYNFSLDNPPNTNGKGAYGEDADNSFDYGLAGGLGIEIRTGIGFFLLEGRYYYGLADVFGNHKSDYYAKSGNQSMYVTLSYLIPWKK